MVSFNSAAPAESSTGRPGLARVATSTLDKAAERCLRVFLVEDSVSLRERLGDFLSEPGKIEMIGFAATETDAVRELTSQPVDVAIVDLNLKEGTGLGVIESIRARHAKAPPTIIVLTNYAFPEFEAACLERGADYFFDKSTQFGAVKVLLQSIRRGEH
jgi:two-component system OmpR family response regulator